MGQDACGPPHLDGVHGEDASVAVMFAMLDGLISMVAAGRRGSRAVGAELSRARRLGQRAAAGEAKAAGAFAALRCAEPWLGCEAGRRFRRLRGAGRACCLPGCGGKVEGTTTRCARTE